MRISYQGSANINEQGVLWHWETLVSHPFTQDVQLNKQTKVKLFCKFIESFIMVVQKLGTWIFRPGSLVMTGIHKWSLVLLWKCPIKQTNQFTRFSKVLKRFQQDSEEIKNGDFQTGFFGAERDKTLVMTGIHKWSHAQYFTTRLNLIFHCSYYTVVRKGVS